MKYEYENAAGKLFLNAFDTFYKQIFYLRLFFIFKAHTQKILLLENSTGIEGCQITSEKYPEQFRMNKKKFFFNWLLVIVKSSQFSTFLNTHSLYTVIVLYDHDDDYCE